MPNPKQRYPSCPERCKATECPAGCGFTGAGTQCQNPEFRDEVRDFEQNHKVSVENDDPAGAGERSGTGAAQPAMAENR